MNTYGWALIDHNVNSLRLVDSIFLSLDELYEYLDGHDLVEDFGNTDLEVRKIEIEVSKKPAFIEDRDVMDEARCTHSGYDYSKILKRNKLNANSQ